MSAVLDTSVLIGADAPGDVEAAIEAAFDPLPISVEVARAWGRLAASVTLRGGNPRRRADRSRDSGDGDHREGSPAHYDFEIIEDLVDARRP